MAGKKLNIFHVRSGRKVHPPSPPEEVGPCTTNTSFTEVQILELTAAHAHFIFKTDKLLVCFTREHSRISSQFQPKFSNSQHSTAKKKKSDWMLRVISWNSSERNFTWNFGVICEKCWKRQLWRFDTVFDYFIMFTELANTF